MMMSRHRSLHRRVLCLWLPRLPTDRIQRQTEWQQRPDALAPLVLVAKTKGAERVVAVDDRAAGAGLKPGMALAEARAVVPGLLTLPHAPEADARALEQIADWADRYTPMVGRDPPSGLFLDLTGASHLAGGDAALATDLLSRLGGQGFRPAQPLRRQRVRRGHWCAHAGAALWVMRYQRPNSILCWPSCPCRGCGYRLTLFQGSIGLA